MSRREYDSAPGNADDAYHALIERHSSTEARVKQATPALSDAFEQVEEGLRAVKAIIRANDLYDTTLDSEVGQLSAQVGRVRAEIGPVAVLKVVQT